jgi:hypothetical protein
MPYAEFYVVNTSTRFSPGGFNYIVLDQISSKPTYAHVTFDTGFYNATAAGAALAAMHQRGFNLVRVFLDHGDAVHQNRGQYGVEGSLESNDLYSPFVENFADFLRRARSYKVYVLPVLSGIPLNRHFETMMQSGELPHIAGNNKYYLTPGGIQAKVEYARELVHDIREIDNGALLTSVLAWELEVEVFLTDQWEPFSLHSGSVTTADGRTYDMGNAESRQRCMDANLTNWATQVSNAIRSEDRDALVTAGFFTYDAVRKPGPNGLLRTSENDPRYPGRPLILERTKALSFIDVHAYPKSYFGYSLASDLESLEYSKWNLREMPFLLGEFGASKRLFPNLPGAIAAVRGEQEDARKLGLAGTLFWTWDILPEGAHQWSAMEDDAAILKALVPPQ